MKLTFTIPGTTLKFYIDHDEKTLKPKKKWIYRLEIAGRLPKGFIPFHASLLKSPSGSLFLSGASLSGKSTMVSKLTDLDFEVQASDFVIVWEKDGHLFAADLNLANVNKGKKPVLVDKFVFLAPDDPRDCFRFTQEQAKNFYDKSLRFSSSENFSRFFSDPVFEKVISSHFVLGNRISVDRWYKTLSLILNKRRIKKVGIIGVGVIGQEIANLLLQEDWLTQLNLFSPNQKKLLGVTLDLKSANPNVNVFKHTSFLEVIKKSDLLVFCFRVQPKKKVSYGGERMGKLFSHAKAIWEITRDLRKVNYSGKILVVTNPVDILSWATYYFSNLDEKFELDWKGLDSNQVMGIGLGLDDARLKTLTNLPLELIGEHGDKIIIAKRRRDDLIKTKQRKILDLVKNYSPRIRKFTERIKFGPAHEILRVINSLQRNRGILRVSSLDEKSVFLGNVFKYSNSLLTPRYQLSPSLKKDLEKVRFIHQSYQEKILKEIRSKKKLS